MSGGELSGEMSDTVTAALVADPADDPSVLDQLDSEEGGVSSSAGPGASQDQGAGRAGQSRTRERVPIVWDQGPESSGSGSGAPPASTSPVRGAGRGGATSGAPTGAGAALVS